MRLNSEKINDLNFDFKKKDLNIKNAKNRSTMWSRIIIALLFLDISTTIFNVRDQLNTSFQKSVKDYEEYGKLKAITEDKNFDINKVKEGFSEYQPQTNVGKMLLLIDFVYFKNEYYKGKNVKTNYTEKEGKEISDYLEKSIIRERIEPTSESIKCNFSITCPIVAYYVNDRIYKTEKVLNNVRRKLYFELYNKDKVKNFIDLDTKEKLYLLDNKQDVFSKNLW